MTALQKCQCLAPSCPLWLRKVTQQRILFHICVPGHREIMFMQPTSVCLVVSIGLWSASDVSQKIFCVWLWKFLTINHIWLQVAKKHIYSPLSSLRTWYLETAFSIHVQAAFFFCLLLFFFHMWIFFKSPKTCLTFCFFYKAQVPTEIRSCLEIFVEPFPWCH